MFVGILYTDISDHFPIFHIDFSTKIPNTIDYVRRRIFSNENMNRFSSLLSSSDWNHITQIDDAQDAYTSFHNQFSLIYETSFPLKILS